MTDSQPSPQTVSGLLVAATVLHVFAFSLTSFRLWFRYHIRRLWWDDLWAALALLCDTVCVVVMWVLSAPLDTPYEDIEAWPTPALSRSTHIISFWLAMLFYTCVIWFTRISIISSVVRIVPPARVISVTAFSIGGVFFCMFVYVLACKSVVCSVDKSWYQHDDIQCPIPIWVALSEIITDVLSDLVLVVLPLRLLWRVKLPSNHRIMVLSVFSTSILVSVVSAVHTSYLIPEVTYVGGATAEIGGAISLIVCNLLVVVTFVYRLARNGRDLTAGVSGKNDRLTTVDLAWFTTVGTDTGCTNTLTPTSNLSTLAFANASASERGDVIPDPPPLLPRQ